MKKSVLSIVLIAVIIVIFGIAYLYNHENSNINKLTSEQILNIIKSEVISYCKALDDKVINSACPTCRFYYSQNDSLSYIYVNDFSEEEGNIHKYKVENVSNGFLVTVQLDLVYGRNDRSGHQTISFNLDKLGNVLNKDIPIAECK